MERIFKPVPFYEGYYEVSNDGVVRSLARRINTSGGRTRVIEGAELHPAHDGRYLKVNLSKEGKMHRHYVHALVLKAFVGLPQSGQECCHKDCNPLNNRVENLRWDNRKGNMGDTCKAGKMRRKLTADAVLAIRSSAETGVSLAQQYGVTPATISSVRNRRIWAHV